MGREPGVLVRYLHGLRTDRGWSQRDVHVRGRITSSAVSLWERGLTDPQLENFIDYARIFGLTVALLDNRGRIVTTAGKTPPPAMHRVHPLVVQLKERRKKLRLTQAKVPGIPQNHITLWENGWRMPSLENLQAYAAALGLQLTFRRRR